MELKSNPKKWKVALLTWICIYPLLNVCTFLLYPYIGELPQLIRTLIVTVILVPIMVLTLGQLQQKFSLWLRK